VLLSLNSITFEFGARAILKDATWHIYANERIGLIGLNGAGKSTLLKILVGEYTITGGQLNKSNSLKIGYFHQNLQSEDVEESILNIAMGAYDEALAVKNKLDAVNDKMEVEVTDKLIEQQADLLEKFEIAGGYEMEYKSAEVLEGLGFATKDLNRPFKEFSGGWRMRVLLGKMILQQPDILLLDEPTNHLDLPSIEWIERYLQSYAGSIVIVSHDRYFLDKMVTKVVEISGNTLNHYAGNYTKYESEKEVRAEFQRREYENQKDYIRQQERFVERFKAKASKATLAQSIVKKLDKLERVDAPDSDAKRIAFKFEMGHNPGKIIATLKDVSKAYGESVIFQNASAVINRGDKIALIGPNGQGKSTLLRIISGHEQIEGERIEGHNVATSFYAQHQLEALTQQNEILKELSTSGSKRTDLELRQLLGCFLFGGDDVQKKIKVLSGGEKARVALAKTIIQESNFLMLDEPTNHLDINSVESLVDALNAYEGTYVVVSHDRFFIQKTATVIWEIEDKKIRVFDGNYDEWLLFKEKQKERESKSNKKDNAFIAERKQEKKKEKAKPKGQKIDKEAQKAERKVRNQFKKIEEAIVVLEKQLSDKEAELASPDIYADKEKFKSVEGQYNTVKEKLAAQRAEYEIIFEKLLEYED
jgi:ATP-binding cassette subfamily F protein 3